MCIFPALIGKAVGGRSGAIAGAALGGGLPGALAASQIFKKKKPQQPGPSMAAPTSFGGS